MKIKLVLSLIIVLMCIEGIFAMPIAAPHAFYGEIKCSDEKIINSGSIIAKIDGDIKDSSTITFGKYGYDDSFIVESTSTQTINFYFNNKIIGSHLFEPLGITRLDFIIDCTTEQSPENKKSSSRSGGGGTRIIGGEGESSYICEENWQCGEWSECVNNEQTRTCTDLSRCGTTVNKPIQSQECNNETSSTNLLTAAVTGITNFAKSPAGTATIIATLTVLIAGASIVIVKKIRR